jgi:Holliday junction resolvase RusA-like endonuclease
MRNSTATITREVDIMVHPKIIIPGNPMVKKNNQKVAFVSGRPHKYDTKAYKAWHTVALETLGYTLKFAYRTKVIDEPVILCCQFYMQTRRKVDLSNLYEGIQDVLVEVGILADDHSGIVIGHDGSRVHYDKDNPRVEVEIKEVIE